MVRGQLDEMKEDNLGDRRVMNASAKRKMAWFATKVRKPKEEAWQTGSTRRASRKQGHDETGGRKATPAKHESGRGTYVTVPSQNSDVQRSYPGGP